MTQRFEGENGQLKALHCIRIDEKFQPIPESEFVLHADLALLAMGFVSPITEGMIADLGIELDDRQNVSANTSTYKTNHDKVWAAGDMRRGQSLVVWAIREGRQCAHAVDKALMGVTVLPR
jgi:glutamate synthase (NADPH/NADH) small chain